MPYDHEAEVANFLGAARLSDPEKHALVCSKYPVKSRRQMQRISKTEIPVGLHPGKFASDRPVAAATDQPYEETA